MLKVAVVFASILACAVGAKCQTKPEAIRWGTCSTNFTNPAIECGSLSVPLDYTNEASGEKLSLELLRIPVAKGKSKGSIIFNFGGPGASGEGDFDYYSERLRIITGGQHDLITFVPRGTGKTLSFSCFASEAERAQFLLANPFVAGNSSDVALGQTWARAKLFVDACYSAQNGTTTGLIGTAFVARDMMRIVDALKEDGMLRYWGISYGTLLGSTVAAMFPERMDKVVLDGVVNPHEYYHDFETEVFTDIDAAFSGFIAGCVKSPTLCPLATGAGKAKIYAFIDDLKYNPIPISLSLPGSGGGLLVDYTLVRSLTQSLLYFPSTWPLMASLYNALLTGDTATLTAYITSISSSSSGSTLDPMRGIKCGDSLARASKLSDVLPAIYDRHEKSRIAGDIADFVLMHCARWRLPAKEIYKGDFKVKTRKPVFIVNGRYDPVTPLVSARNVSAGFKDSVVLEWNGYGHGIFAQGSLCAAKALRSYFVDGTLPKKGNVCEVDGELFSGADNWEAALKELDGTFKPGKKGKRSFVPGSESGTWELPSYLEWPAQLKRLIN